MTFSYCLILPSSFATSRGSVEPGFKQAFAAANLPTFEPIPLVGPSPTPKSESVPGSVSVDSASIPLPIPATDSDPASGGPPPTTSLGFQQVEIPSPVVYSKAELQRLLSICRGAKRSSSNEPHSTLKVHFFNLYSGKSYLNCYQFCQLYKDFFNTTGASGNINTSLTALFLLNIV